MSLLKKIIDSLRNEGFCSIKLLSAKEDRVEGFFFVEGMDSFAPFNMVVENDDVYFTSSNRIKKTKISSVDDFYNLVHEQFAQ